MGTMDTIAVFGSINLDLVARVERLPAPGETVAGTDFSMHPGGKGANQALAARRAGHGVAMIGAVGSDPNADGATSLLRKAGIAMDSVISRQATPTGVALILVDAARGENQIAVVPGANFEVRALAAPALGNARALLLQLEIPLPVVEAALDTARAAGVTTFLNLAPWRDVAAALAAKADVVIVNETEFAGLAASLGHDAHKADDPVAVRALAGLLGPGMTLVVTLGAAGAHASDGHDVWSAAAPAIAPVDTVGAGDTFCGYLAAARTEAMAWPEALNLACRAGALACLKTGAQSAIPTRAEVDAFVS